MDQTLMAIHRLKQYVRQAGCLRFRILLNVFVMEIYVSSQSASSHEMIFVAVFQWRMAKLWGLLGPLGGCVEKCVAAFDCWLLLVKQKLFKCRFFLSGAK